MIILVINAGSSSLKYQLINMKSETILTKGVVECIGMENGRLKFFTASQKQEIAFGIVDHMQAVSYVLDIIIDREHGAIQNLSQIEAVGHRIVHGGEDFRESHLLDEEVMKVLNDNVEMAPLHNPANIICVQACKNLLPNAHMVGVFDTAFHSTIPPKGYLYAIPMEAYKKHKIRRYGFHGISHCYVARKAAQILKKDFDTLKIITCHLGNGSSITAIKNGKAVDTSMGFTPLEGLAMGTRCGDIDPTVIQYLVNKMDMTLDEVLSYLNKKSGVLGISGISSDFRDLERAVEAGDKNAKLAVDIFCYRVKKYIGAYIAVMDGVDIIVFTAGIGENSPEVRERIIEGMNYINIKLDKERNSSKDKAKIISSKESQVVVMTIPTDEELMIAKETVATCSNE